MSVDYFIYLGSSIAVWAMASLGFQLIVGFAGIINLGYVALMGMGGYAYALLTYTYGVNPLLALIVASVAPIPFGVLLSVLTKRVKGDYLALMTLWFSFVVTVLMLNLDGLTRGALGIPGIQKPALFSGEVSFSVFLSVSTGALAYVLVWFKQTPLGLVMAAIRDDELAAESLGKRTFYVKVLAFVFSSIIAGISGAFLAMFLQFIDPFSFYLPQLILVLTFVIVGGLASVRGTITAAFILMLLPEVLRFVELPSEVQGAFRAIIYSLVLLVILIYRPKGLFGKIELE